jgi:hypothetical protein
VFNFVIGQTFLPVVQAVGGPAVFMVGALYKFANPVDP